MNKRILELKDQCYIPVADRYGDTEYDIDKFAELIVTECIQVINGDIYFQANKGILTNVGGLNQARCLISHHFEVELTKDSVPLRN